MRCSSHWDGASTPNSVGEMKRGRRSNCARDYWIYLQVTRELPLRVCHRRERPLLIALAFDKVQWQLRINPDFRISLSLDALRKAYYRGRKLAKNGYPQNILVTAIIKDRPKRKVGRPAQPVDVVRVAVVRDIVKSQVATGCSLRRAFRAASLSPYLNLSPSGAREAFKKVQLT